MVTQPWKHSTDLQTGCMKSIVTLSRSVGSRSAAPISRLATAAEVCGRTRGGSSSATGIFLAASLACRPTQHALRFAPPTAIVQAVEHVSQHPGCDSADWL